jgi:hypothetical protein
MVDAITGRCLHKSNGKRTSLANVDKNTMADERIPILDLIKVVEMLLPRRRSANSLKEISDHFI